LSFSAIFNLHASKQKQQQFWIIGIIAIAHGSSHFFQLVLASLFPFLMQDFNLTYQQVSLPVTLFFVISGFGQSFAGFAVDKFGAEKVLIFGQSCLVIAGFTLALSPNYLILFAVAAIAGIGNAIYHPADFTILNRKISESLLPYSFAMHGLSGNLGWAAAPALLVFVALISGWRAAAYVATSIELVILVMLIIQQDLIKVTDDLNSIKQLDDYSAKSGMLDFLKVPAVWLCFGFFFCMAMAFGAFQSFGTLVLKEAFTMSQQSAAHTITLFLICSAVGVLIGGFLASKGGNHDYHIVITLVVSSIMATILAFKLLPIILVPIIIGFIGFCNGLAGPSRDLMVRRAATARFGKQAFGRIYGLVYSGIDSGMALSPLLFGLFMDLKLFSYVLLGVAVFQVLAIFTALNVGKMSNM